MKYFLPLLLILLKSLTVAAQDTIRVTYSEEPDTLSVRQKFIDRYDNVFMTRVPTKHIVKAGYRTSDLRGIGIGVDISYEYKLLPFLSVEATLRGQTNAANDAIYSRTFVKPWRGNTWLGAKARWYYAMPARIRKGLNANNFSGAYLAMSYELPLKSIDRYNSSPYKRIVGVASGFQSRFLNWGHIDISFGAYYTEPRPREASWHPLYSNKSPVDFKRNIIFSTQMTVGIALGDWKRSLPSQLCEVLLCDEEIHNQWKLRFPEFSIGLDQQSLRTGIAREAKFGKSPFSLDMSANAEFYDRKWDSVRGSSIKVGLQPRYYFLQRMQIRRGKSGNNLSGFYTAFEIAMLHTKYGTTGYFPNINERYWSISPSIGFQQRLFKHIYVDTNVGYHVLPADVPYPYDALHRRYSARLELGFTF
ncbi:hypothetical protein GCM10007423_57750 [Dyadobacter endophyticus]|uniref:Phosphate-selective porin O and P n=1 Tax=Dyadobacter endophyticus TaxID=1749036 RepID=A0ABQ1Z7E0_9BACT|nr:hypothetical protein [Dyadobacter endophyticus]GGH52871.1 hypothetical protein GCM10007423_57750 [Dyadobacter endophyticus]